MSSKLDFSELLNDSIRILIIASAVKDIKSITLSEHKIKLCDYYLKFPLTMFDAEQSENSLKVNFDEYYAFFHWHPDTVRYRRALNYLLAKGLLTKKLHSQVIYQITEQGSEAIDRIENHYKESLVRISAMMVKEIKRLSSDASIEKDIQKKSELLSKRMV